LGGGAEGEIMIKIKIMIMSPGSGRAAGTIPVRGV
jgi:hypothetical protein